MSVGEIQLEQGERLLFVSLHGEHDLSTAEALQQELERAREAKQPVLVDLSAAAFIDSAVLGVLIGEHDRATADGVPMGLVVGGGAGHAVRRIIELTGLDSVLPVFANRDDAERIVLGA
jgi:anti-anti-sigma factor